MRAIWTSKPPNRGICYKVGGLRVSPRGASFAGRRFPCALGRSGLTADKREGDGSTPLGTHRFVGLLFRPDRVSRTCLPNWARPIGAFDRWSDDPRDSDYNHYLPNGPRPGYSSEALRRADPLYDIVLLTDWNWPLAVKGAGSAIFVHCWRKPRHPTEGCVAFARGDLLWIVNRLQPADRLVVTR